MIFLLSITGCLSLDALLPFHKNVHCSEVGPATCDPEILVANTPTYDAYWDTICTPCEESYQWDKEIDWAGEGRRPQIFDDVTEIPQLPADVVQDADIDVGDAAVELDAYFIPSNGSVPEFANTTIVYNHGRYAGIEAYISRVRVFYSLGFNVFVWDYRGYGKSTPPELPTSKDWMSDAVAAFEAAVDLAPDKDKVIIYGMSVGTMPAAEMSKESNACAQIFEASALSNTEKVEDNMSLMMPASFFTSGYLEGDAKLKDTTKPTLFLHGDMDDRTLLATAQNVFDNLPDDIAKEFIIVPGAGHGLGASKAADGTVKYDKGSIVEQGYGAYRGYLTNFLTDKAPGCLTAAQ